MCVDNAASQTKHWLQIANSECNAPMLLYAGSPDGQQDSCNLWKPVQWKDAALLQACALELSKGNQVWAQVTGNDKVQEFLADPAGAAYLAGLQQVWRVALLLQAGADLHGLARTSPTASQAAFQEASRESMTTMSSEYLECCVQQVQQRTNIAESWCSKMAPLLSALGHAFASAMFHIDVNLPQCSHGCCRSASYKSVSYIASVLCSGMSLISCASCDSCLKQLKVSSLCVCRCRWCRPWSAPTGRCHACAANQE